MELQGQEVFIVYKNWKGVVGHRKIRPINIWYGKTEYHPQEQWFINATDLDKSEERNFAIGDIMYWHNFSIIDKEQDSAPTL